VTTEMLAEVHTEATAESPLVGARPRLGDTARQGTLVLVDQAIVSGTNFCATLLVARFASQAELGTYALGFTVLFLALSIQQSLVCLPLTVYGARLREQSRRFLSGSTLLHGALIAAAASFCLLGTALVVWLADPSTMLSPLVMTLGFSLPFVLLREFARRYEFARLAIGRALVMDLCASALQLAGLAALAWRDQLSAVAAHAWLGIASAAVCGSWLLATWGQFRFDRNRAVSDFGKHAALGKWALASSMLWLTNAYLPHWLLAFRYGLEATGLLTACMTLIDLSNPLLIGMSNLVGPRAAHAFHDEGRRGLRRIVGWSALIAGICMGLFASASALLGVQIIDMLLNIDISEHVAVVGLLALAVFTLSPGLAHAEGLSAMERPRLNFLASGAGLLATLVVTAALIEPLGLIGAAAAILAGYATASAVRMSFFWWCSSAEYDREEPA